ncbi:MAG: hypothetical protein HYZ75_05650 [Elusimicrobia bacterium]|nr:hypothetical protein [Elusimicrobiota bacterium]
MVLALLLSLTAHAAAPGLTPRWTDFNRYEVVGFSASHIAVREYYTPDRGSGGDPVDCGYKGLEGVTIDANRSAREVVRVPARGLSVHLLPYEPQKLAQLRTPHALTHVYPAVTARARCRRESDAALLAKRARTEAAEAGIDAKEPPVTERVFRRVDLGSCRDPEHEEGCVQKGQLRLGGKLIELKLAVQTGNGRMEVSGDVLTGKKGFRFRLGHTSDNSFTMLPLELYRQGGRTLLMFQFAEVFMSDRRRTAYFMVF